MIQFADICPDPFPKIEELWEILTKHPDKLNKENKSPQKDQQKTDVRQPINVRQQFTIRLLTNSVFQQQQQQQQLGL